MKPVFPLMTIILFSSLLFNACIKSEYFPCIRGKGDMVEAGRYTPEFNQIDLRLEGQVIVSFGSDTELSIMAPENLHDIIETRVSGNRLVIEQNRCIRSKSDEILIYLTIPDLESILISGSGSVRVTELWSESMIRCAISGSGNIYARVNCETINSQIAGSGNIHITGKTNEHAISISGSGGVNGKNLTCKNADIRISGSGHTWVAAEDKIEARISGSGNIYYRGNPSIQANISGTGSIVPF